MNKALKELTNIGVPVYTPLSLWIQDMTLTCSDHIGKTISLERDIRRETIDRVEKAVGKESKIASRDYLVHINFFANDKSTSVFDLANKQRIINVSENLIDNEKLEGNTTEEVLEKLKKEKEEFYKLLEYINFKLYTKDFHKYMKENYKRFYSGTNVKYDLRSYMNSEYSFNNEFENQLDEVFKIDFTDLLTDYTDDLNPEKVSIYLAGYYMDEALRGIIENNPFKTQEALFYISAFLRSGVDKSIVLPMNGRGETSYSSLKEDYQRLLNDYQYLNDIYMKRKNFENKNLDDNKKAIDSLIHMKKIIVDESFVKPGYKKETKNHTGKKRIITEPTEAEKREIADYLDYKRYQFLKHHPIAQIDCEEEFSNYTAFLYENGLMPADRFKNVNNMSQMKADSIYIFDALTYKDRMKENKSEIRESYPIKPLNHSGSWEERLEELTKKDTSDEMKEKAKELVKNRTN